MNITLIKSCCFVFVLMLISTHTKAQDESRWGLATGYAKSVSISDVFEANENTRIYLGLERDFRFSYTQRFQIGGGISFLDTEVPQTSSAFPTIEKSTSGEIHFIGHHGLILDNLYLAIGIQYDFPLKNSTTNPNWTPIKGLGAQLGITYDVHLSNLLAVSVRPYYAYRGAFLNGRSVISSRVVSGEAGLVLTLFYKSFY